MRARRLQPDVAPASALCGPRHRRGADHHLPGDRFDSALALASLFHVEQGDLFEDEVGPLSIRDGLGLAIGDAKVFQRLAFRIEDSVVAAPSHVVDEIVDIRRTEEDHADGRRILAETYRPDRVLNLPRPGRIEQGLHRNGARGHRPRLSGPDRMEGRGLEMIAAEDRSRVEKAHLRPARGSPLRHGSDHGFRLDIGSFRPRDIERHGKSPRAAWPSISRTSTGAPTCSLIFIASAEPIVGMRARSLGFAFCRSFNVLKPRWNRARPRTRPTPRREISSKSSSLMPYWTWIVRRVSARTFFLLKIRPSSPIEYRSHSAWSVIRRMSPGPIPNLFVTSSSVRSVIQSPRREAVFISARKKS